MQSIIPVTFFLVLALAIFFIVPTMHGEGIKTFVTLLLLAGGFFSFTAGHWIGEHKQPKLEQRDTVITSQPEQIDYFLLYVGDAEISVPLSHRGGVFKIAWANPISEITIKIPSIQSSEEVKLTDDNYEVKTLDGILY